MTDMKVTDLMPGDVLLVKSDHYKPAGLTIERVKVVRKMSGTLEEWVAETEAISTVDGSMSEPYVMDYMFTMNSLMIERVPAPVFDKAMHLREMYLAGLRGLVSGSKLIEGADKDGGDNDTNNKQQQKDYGEEKEQEGGQGTVDGGPAGCCLDRRDTEVPGGELE